MRQETIQKKNNGAKNNTSINSHFSNRVTDPDTFCF